MGRLAPIAGCLYIVSLEQLRIIQDQREDRIAFLLLVLAMVPFGRPKRRMPDVQDDDISLADLPKIRAEINSRRASDGEDFVKAGESSKRSLDVQSSRVGDIGMADVALGEASGEGKTIGEERGMSVDEDSLHGRSGYALSVEESDKKDTMERERWTGRVNEKRDESRFKGICRVAMRHLRFVGPGLVSSVSVMASSISQ